VQLTILSKTTFWGYTAHKTRLQIESKDKTININKEDQMKYLWGMPKPIAG